jgi:uncharacterized protein (TIGR02117 family)
MKSVLKYLKYLLVIIVLPVLLYFLGAFIGSVIPVNEPPDKQEADIRIYLWTNGMHTDIVMPVNTEIIDWREIAKPEHVISSSRDFNYIAFGWGDLEFYRNVPSWRDLTPGIGFRALFLPSPSAMHIKFHHHITENEYTLGIDIDRKQFELLAEFIKNSFEYDSEENPQLIEDLHYDDTDAFYRAKRSLNLFYTCNTWANDALKHSGLTACLWTPFAEGVFYHHR